MGSGWLDVMGDGSGWLDVMGDGKTNVTLIVCLKS